MCSITTSNLDGYLYKWTNYVKGYKKRWFVLQDGFLSYYRHEKELTHRCRGTINIASATVHVTDNLHFVIANRGAQTYYLRSLSEVEQKQWLCALELAKNKAILLQQKALNLNVTTQEPSAQADHCLNELTKRLQELRKSHDTAEKKCEDLSRVINEFEGYRCSSQGISNASLNGNSPNNSLTVNDSQNSRLVHLSERANVLRLSTKALIKASSEYQNMAALTVKRLKVLFEEDRTHIQRLEQMVEDLAKQHSSLEDKIRAHSIQQSNTDSPDESFYDATEDLAESSITLSPGLFPASPGNTLLSSPANSPHTLMKNPLRHSPNRLILNVLEEEQDNCESDMEDESSSTSCQLDDLGSVKGDCIVRCSQLQRKPHQNPQNKMNSLESGKNSVEKQSVDSNSNEFCLPIRAPMTRRSEIPPKPNISIDLWSIMKNCIGKDLSRIPMPVNFSEPLSMLQRLSEDFEYSECLDKAAQCHDSIEAMAYVAAFTVSSYANTVYRVHKPFNPLLGETFECDRTDDLGWRLLAEQISHHPPEAATHCESGKWYSWQNFSMSTKFRGKYLKLHPLGSAHLIIRHCNHHYVWRKVTSTIHNIVVGKLWLDNAGEMQIVNHTTGDVCTLTYQPYSYFVKDKPRRVRGTIHNRDGHLLFVLNGTWDKYLEGMRVSLDSTIDSPDILAFTQQQDPHNETAPLQKHGPVIRLWEAHSPLPPEAEKMYNFGAFAVSLNEAEPNVAPTDSRFRPDQRLMELGRWEEANQEKLRLELQQRKRAKKASSASILSTAALNESVLTEMCQEEGSSNSPVIDNNCSPLWFQRVIDEDTGLSTVKFTGEYWKHKATGDWSICPHIF